MARKVTRWNISIDKVLAAQVETRLFDTIRDRTIYGARAKLITELLEQWVLDNPTEQEA